MSRPCPNCGTSCATEARFCRLCGTPLKPVGTGSAPVSPGAQTMPLSDEGRTTHGLSAEDGSASSPETARVRRAEMESILRRNVPAPSAIQESNGSQALADSEAAAAPVTTALVAGAEDKRRAREDSAGAHAASANGAREEKAQAVTVVDESRAQASSESRAEASAEGRAGVSSESRAQASSPAKLKTARPRLLWPVAALALTGAVVVGGALFFYYSRRAGEGDAGSTTTSSGNDQHRIVEEKLTEAEALLAEGKVTDAIARLRYATRAEPSNARAHRLLAEALERTGAVNEAIDEYRAAAQYDPGNEEILMRYADALRRVGRTEEAREIYQKLSSSSSADVASAAKEQSNALATQPLSNAETEGAARTTNRAEETATNTGAPASTRATTTQPNANGAGSSSSSAAMPKNDPVASYNTAMKIIEGKDIRKMNRAELIRAYELFQYAQRGPRAADANRHLQELDKELFERRKRK